MVTFEPQKLEKIYEQISFNYRSFINGFDWL